MTLVSALVLGHSLLTKVNGLWFWVQCQLWSVLIKPEMIP